MGLVDLGPVRSFYITIGDKEKFISLTIMNGGKVTFGDNVKGKVVGRGKVRRMSHYFTDDVLLVEGLKHNLLRISQFCIKVIK